MSPVKAEEASVIRLQFLNPLPCVCYLFAVLGPMTLRFTKGAEGFRRSLGLPLGLRGLAPTWKAAAVGT